MDLSRVNLNLLVALQVLLQERHVTNAGKRLNITQSAMSNILKQLREAFNDELFTRGKASSMIPTPKALSLAPKIDETLKKIQCIFSNMEKFDHQKDKYTFKIGLSDHSEFIFLPKLAKLITQSAPHVKIIVKNMTFIKDESVFENDEIDLAIGLHHMIPDTLISQDILSESVAVVGCKENELLKNPMSIEEYAKARQLLVMYPEKREHMWSEKTIQEMGLERNVLLTLPDTLAAIHAIPGTPLVMSVLKRIVIRLRNQLPLAVQPSPFKYPPIQIRMVWHPKNRHYPPHVWLREEVQRIASEIERDEKITCLIPSLE